jgi:hypothetical protein
VGGSNRVAQLSRRRTLKVLAGAASAVAFPILTSGLPRSGAQGSPRRAPLPIRVAKFFNAQQIRTIDALSESIIPADKHFPGAKAAGVCACIDALVADSDEHAKSFWTEGLAAIDKMAQSAYGKKYADCAPQHQEALLQKLSANEQAPKTLEERFLVAIERTTIDSYYTSQIAIPQELKPRGDTTLAQSEGGKHEGRRKQQAECRRR